jgi:hypothetical protein
MIRIGYYDRSSPIPFHDADAQPRDQQEEDAHLQHCFDYLRQSIMCCSDTTLEIIPRMDTPTDGWGYEHQCRNYGAVMAWAEEERMSNSTGII